MYKGKAIYNPSGKAKEYSYWACNFYVGCSNCCEYCYLKKGRGSNILGGNEPKLKKCFKNETHALEIFTTELNKNLEDLREHGLFFSFSTDPLLPECSDLTWNAVMTAMGEGVPVKILTKISGIWVDQIVEHMDLSWSNLIAFGFTLTGHDELEPFASTNQDRINSLKKLHSAGFKTFASIEPIIDFRSAMNVIVDSYGFCDLYKIGLQSGKTYEKIEALNFIKWLRAVIVEPKIYIKESLRKLTGYEMPGKNFIDRDYNIFKTQIDEYIRRKTFSPDIECPGKNRGNEG